VQLVDGQGPRRAADGGRRMIATWHLLLVGLPWYVVVPLAAALLGASLALLRRECAEGPLRARRVLMTLRTATILGVALIALEPTVTHSRSATEPARVAVVVDASGSMAITDPQMAAMQRLDEAVTLGYLPPGQRPDPWRRGAAEVAGFGADLDAILAGAVSGDTSPQARAQTAAICGAHLVAAATLAKELAGAATFASYFQAQHQLAERLSERLATTISSADAQLSNDVAAFRPRLQPTAARLLAAQADSDAALLAGAAADSTLAKALAQVRVLSRFERERRLLSQVILPGLSPVATVETMVLGTDTPPLTAQTTAHGATDFAGPLSHLARDWHAGQALAAAVLLISDGRQTAGADPAPAARALAARGVPVWTIAIGDPQPPRDAVVAELHGPQEIFKGETVRLDARLRITGYDGTSWDLILARDGVDVERRVVHATGTWQSERFEHQDAVGGLHAWRVRLERSANDPVAPTLAVAPEASTQNNQADCTVAVVDDPLRVLLVDAEPRWDTRYLGVMFERDPRAHVDRRYRSVLIARGEHELLPTAQEMLDRYDIIVLGDISADELSSAGQSHLLRFVAERGGCLVCLSGPRGMPQSYGLGAVADLLPIHVAATLGDCRQTATVSLPPAGSFAGLASSITTILDDPTLNRKLWPALAPLQWFVPDSTPKPGAEVLLTADDPSHSPVLVVQQYGAGRVLWLGTDETWRWRDRLGERVHQTFWLQAVRWGLGSRLHGQDPRLQAAVDRLLIEPGGSLELMARARTAAGALIRVASSATLSRLDEHGVVVPGGENHVELHEQDDAAGLFHAVVHGLGEGRWRITFTNPSPECDGISETREVVVRSRADQEGVDLAADPESLGRLSVAGGGHAATIAQVSELVAQLTAQLHPVQTTQVRVWRIWGGYSCLLVVVALLTAEWWLRRRWGLP